MKQPDKPSKAKNKSAPETHKWQLYKHNELHKYSVKQENKIANIKQVEF